METVLIASVTLLVALTLCISVVPSKTAAQEDLPNTFFFTHYELLGDPNNPEGVRYHSNGKPSAKAPDGSKITLSGQGGWDPGRAKPPKAVVDVPSRMPPERSQRRDRGK